MAYVAAGFVIEFSVRNIPPSDMERGSYSLFLI